MVCGVAALPVGVWPMLTPRWASARPVTRAARLGSAPAEVGSRVEVLRPDTPRDDVPVGRQARSGRPGLTNWASRRPRCGRPAGLLVEDNHTRVRGERDEPGVRVEVSGVDSGVGHCQQTAGPVEQAGDGLGAIVPVLPVNSWVSRALALAEHWPMFFAGSLCGAVPASGLEEGVAYYRQQDGSARPVLGKRRPAVQCGARTSPTRLGRGSACGTRRCRPG